MTEYPLSGGCLCGGVRFEVTEPPLRASYCHCTRCQRRTGTAASAQATLAGPAALRVLQGEELVREWQPPDGFVKVFCSRCGSALWSRSPDGQTVSVRMGAFDTDPGIRPSVRRMVDFAAPWEAIPDDGLPRVGGGG